MGIPHATRPGGFRGAVESQVERLLTRVDQVRPCPMRYPFSALVGQDQLKLALLLNAVDPEIGGVLVSGEKGTAKSTAARALVDLLPAIPVREGCPVNSAPHDPISEWLLSTSEPDRTTGREIERPVPFVELPLGANEDRVVGTLDFADSGFIRLGRARELARALRSEYLPLEDLTAGLLPLVIQERRRSAALAFEIGMTDR